MEQGNDGRAEHATAPIRPRKSKASKKWFVVLGALLLLGVTTIFAVVKVSGHEQVNLNECVLEGERVEAQSGDGHRFLLRDGDIYLRIEAETVWVERLCGGRLQLTAVGSVSYPLKVGVLMTGGEANEARFNRIHAIAAANPAPQTFYILQKGWDKGLVEIPTALVLPDSLLETRVWRKFMRRGFVQKISHIDSLGREYLVLAMGRSKVGDKIYPTIPRLERRRPDGTLETYSVHHDGQPEISYIYDLDGLTRIGYVVIYWNRGVPPFVKCFMWRDQTGNYHEYDMNDQSVIRFEWAGELDKNGMFSIGKLLNGRNDLDKATFIIDPEQAVGDIENPLLQASGLVYPPATPSGMGTRTEYFIPPAGQPIGDKPLR